MMNRRHNSNSVIRAVIMTGSPKSVTDLGLKLLGTTATTQASGPSKVSAAKTTARHALYRDPSRWRVASGDLADACNTAALNRTVKAAPQTPNSASRCAENG